MARKKQPPILPLTTDGQRVELVQFKSGYTFRVVGSDGDVEVGVDAAALTAAEWCKVAIQLMVKCPDAKDPIGLVSATADDLMVSGKTLGRQRKWTACLADVGDTSTGDTLLEWTTSRPLDLIEIGAVFKVTIKRLSELSEQAEG